MKTKDGKRYIGTVKIGPKGQIVIPVEVRKMFGMEPGDTILMLADEDRGIAIERPNTVSQIANAIFSGKAQELYPEIDEVDAVAIAHEIADSKSDEEN